MEGSARIQQVEWTCQTLFNFRSVARKSIDERTHVNDMLRDIF